MDLEISTSLMRESRNCLIYNLSKYVGVSTLLTKIVLECEIAVDVIISKPYFGIYKILVTWTEADQYKVWKYKGINVARNIFWLKLYNFVPFLHASIQLIGET